MIKRKQNQKQTNTTKSPLKLVQEVETHLQEPG